ncbi:hypothetical protein [Stenotrophomonas phage vB_SmaS_P15]|uniref:Uncharacterized protein n=1 Tax=Stenotrophomonas phage vB_SmaS_P15 TaxID=2894592 RepID=A0AAE9C6U6_9CAUD|nr:hypothetical protein [Stenotrophomonas phage vB_SmaS_P15]
MIPQPSPEPYRAEWMEKVARRTRPLEAYALGGPQIGVAPEGSFRTQWEFHYRDGAVWVEREGVDPAKLFDRVGITQISACFDQQCQPFVGFTAEDKAYFWMLHPTTGAREFREIPNARTPFCQLDDKRSMTRADADVILSFGRGDKIIALVQRELYNVEHVMGTTLGRITALAPTVGYRLAWRIKETT